MANERADASVVVEVKLDIRDTDKELSRLKSKILRVEESLTVGKHKKDVLTERLAQLRKEYEQVQKLTTVSAGKATLSDENLNKMLKLGAAIKETEAALQKQKTVVDNASMELGGLEARYGEVTQKAEELSAASQNLEQDESSSEGQTEQLSQAQERLAAILEKVKAIAAEGGNSLKIGFKGLLSELAGGLSKAALAAGKLVKSGLSKIGSFAKKAAKGLGSLFLKAKESNKNFSSGIGTMLKYSLGLRSLYALVRKLKSALVDGFKNLAQYSTQTNKSISMVKSALTQLKNSLATAFAPILDTVAPILTKFITMLSTAADYVARLTAAITGKTSYTRATKVQEDYAASLEKTGAAAEDAAGSLAGFDEITTITTEDTKGGGGGASPSEMFEEVAVEPLKFDSWGEAFSSMLDTIIQEGIPKLKSAFSSFATWLNRFSSNLYQMFTFPGVYEKVVQLGAELAGAFNDLVNQIDWATLGGALGAGLNLALGFLVSFIWNFDWMNFGGSIADAINNAVAEIDWRNVGMLMWAKFKIAIETVAGFLASLDMKQLAKAGSDVAMGFFDSITETLEKIDWQQLGNQVAVFLANIDWSGVAISVSQAIGGAFGAAAGFLWGLIKDAWDNVVQWWKEKAFEDGKFTVSGLLSGIWDGIKNIGKWLWNNVFLPFIKGFQKAFGIASPSKVMQEQGKYIMEGLLSGITSLVDKVVNAITGVWDRVKTWWNSNVAQVFSVDYWKNLGKNILNGLLNGLKSVWASIANWVTDKVSWIINKFGKVASDSKAKFSGGQTGGGRISTQSIPRISQADIPRLARGAVVPQNREFLAVLGDNKRETEVVSPLSTMKQAVLEALREAGGEGQTIEVKLYLDGKQIARNQIKHINAITQAAGKPVLLV